MLISQLMKYSSGQRKEQMQTALSSVIGIPRAANDRVHLKNFEDIDRYRIGEFVMQDTFMVCESRRFFARDKEMQCFLFDAVRSITI